MTDNNTQENTVNETPEAPEAPETTEAQETQEGTAGNAEAAKYRRRLRDAEAERDALTGQLGAMRRTEAERVASKHLAAPGAMWAAGTDLADLLDDTGGIDPEKVKAAAENAQATLGAAPPPPGNYVPNEGKNPRPRRNDGMEAVISGGLY